MAHFALLLGAIASATCSPGHTGEQLGDIPDATQAHFNPPQDFLLDNAAAHAAHCYDTTAAGIQHAGVYVPPTADVDVPAPKHVVNEADYAPEEASAGLTFNNAAEVSGLRVNPHI